MAGICRVDILAAQMRGHVGANDILQGDPHIIKQTRHTRRSKTLILPDSRLRASV